MPHVLFAIIVSLAVAPPAPPSSASPKNPAAAASPASPAATLSNEIVIAASPQTLWWALATREGLETWMAPHVEVDLRIGGTIRSTYDPAGVIGDGSTIESTVLAFAPRRMLALKATRFPDGFPFTKQVAPTWAVMFIDPVDAKHTRVTIAGFGYGDDALSRQMMEFFKAGNQEVLDTLKFAIEGRDEAAGEKPAAAPTSGASPVAAPAAAPALAPATSSTPMATSSPADRGRLGALARLPGGDWRCTDTHSNGEATLARELAEFTLDGKAIRLRMFTTGPDGREQQRSETFASFRPDLGELRFIAVSSDGTMREGRIVATDTRTLDYPPRRTTTERGTEVEVKEQLQFIDDDTFAWRAWKREWPAAAAAKTPQPAAAATEPPWTQLAETTWKRTPAAAGR